MIKDIAKGVISLLKKPQPLFFPHGPKAVLLLHAYSGSPNDVLMLSRFLEKQAYTVYAPLFSGHGTMNPLDILQQDPDTWWQESQRAVAFLQQQGYEVAVFGLSMGGIFATRLLTEKSLVGGGFFCSPITPVKTTVPEHFLKYAESVLRKIGADAIEPTLEQYQPLVQQQLQKIEEQAQLAHGGLAQIKHPFLLAQAGQDEMIDPKGVFKTAQRLINSPFTLHWYPTSSHVITVGKARRELERDVRTFLTTLNWKGAENDEND